MTILASCQSAAATLLGRQPSSFFGVSVGTDETEIASLANETAIAIMKAHDWQKLKTLKTHTGNGSATSFVLPTDFDRMLKKGNVHSSLYKTAYFSPVDDEDEWLYLQDTLATATPGFWIILGGAFQIFPAMASTETARYYYISNLIFSGTKTQATADADTFALPERLITLGTIWRWRSKKGLEYAEDMQNFNIALAEEISRDKGSRIITVGRARIPDGVQVAYPGNIIP